jgi:CheY-like chemotaxis protein
MSQPSQLSPPAGKSPGEAVTPPRKRVLLVEGDGFTRLVLLFRLRLAGFQVDFTSNGVLALGKLRSRPPDVLLLELKLGGLSGLELMKAARAEPVFGNRPIYVFTHVDQMNRVARKEIVPLATKLFDKASTTREALVQAFASTFLPKPVSGSSTTDVPGEQILPGALEEIIAGVQEQSRLLGSCKDAGTRGATCGELISRVCSLASCAEAASLPNLFRHAKALENFLSQLRKERQKYRASSLNAVARAVEVMAVVTPGVTDCHPKLARLTAVVVDEEARSGNALEEALRYAHVEPVSFNNPSSARDYLAANPADLVLANIHLPEEHGLALADIRQLPLHEKTPVIFGSEVFLQDCPGEELSASAPRLDSDPLLLKGMVLCALNELQSLSPSAGASQAEAELSEGFAPKMADKAVANANSGAEDGFELFAIPDRPVESVSVHAPATDALAALETVNDLVAWSSERHDSLSTNVQTAPDHITDDPQKDISETLSVQPVDQSQMEQKPLQMVETSGLQPESNAEPTTDVPGNEQTSIVEFFAAAQVDEGVPVEWGPEGTVPETGSVADHVHTAPDDSAQSSQMIEIHGNGEVLAAPDSAAEIELHEVQVESKQKDKTIEALKKQIEDFTAAVAKAQSQPKEPGRDAQIVELEHQVQQGVAALARATAELANERGERQRSDQRVAALNTRLQQLHEELSRTLEAQRESLARIAALEEQLRKTERALTRKTDDVEQQQADLRLADEQLQKAKELNSELTKDRAFFEQAHKAGERARQELQGRLEASVNGAVESESKLHRESTERQRLADELPATQRERQSQSERRETLERELQTAQEALHDREASLQKETAERQHLQEALSAAQLSLREASERSGVECTRLQSALESEQSERKRQETQLARLRHSALDAVRSARALRTSLRRQIREPLDEMLHSAGSLLELELGEHQKKLAEAVLQHVLLVQTKLREPESPQADSHSSEAE